MTADSDRPGMASQEAVEAKSLCTICGHPRHWRDPRFPGVNGGCPKCPECYPAIAREFSVPGSGS